MGSIAHSVVSTDNEKEMSVTNLSGPWSPKTVGMDIGNATTSGITAEGSERIAFFPSVIASVGIGPYDGMSRVSGSNHHVTYDGKHYIVGEEAFQEMGAYPLLSPGLDASNAWKRYVSPESFACFLASIAVLYPDADTVAVNLATGAPLSIYQAHGNEIAKRYVGEHRFVYNGHERTVVVADAKCYGEGRESLRLVPREERMGKIAVYDLGGRTLNVVFFNNGDAKTPITKDFGVDRLFGSIKQVDNDLAVRWRIMREMRESAHMHQDVRLELTSLLDSAVNVIMRDVRLDLADRHYIVGGGAFLLERVLKQRFKAVRVLNRNAPEAANAKSFALAMAGA